MNKIKQTKKMYKKYLTMSDFVIHDKVYIFSVGTVMFLYDQSPFMEKPEFPVTLAGNIILRMNLEGQMALASR